MVATKHSMQEAIEIQRAFERRFAKRGLVGVGIGLNSRRDDLALTVYVSRQNEAAKLPATFSGLDVMVDVVGAVRAL
jgi:hypothetical protein